jgi:hypothetical protein
MKPYNLIGLIVAFALVLSIASSQSQKEKALKAASAKRALVVQICGQRINHLESELKVAQRGGDADVPSMYEDIDFVSAKLKSGEVTSDELGNYRRWQSSIPWVTQYRIDVKGVDARGKFEELQMLSDNVTMPPKAHEVSWAEELVKSIKAYNAWLDELNWPAYVSYDEELAKYVERVKNPKLPRVRDTYSPVD